MPSAAPHYLLFSEASPERSNRPDREGAGGRWKFVLESVDGGTELEAADQEDEGCAERLELLAVIRGLEALPQPSRVTLVTASRYVSRGLRFGLAEWRESDWQWEHFGQMLPVKHADLWKRIDRAVRIHQVQCRTLRFDAPHTEHPVPRPVALPLAPAAGGAAPAEGEPPGALPAARHAPLPAARAGRLRQCAHVAAQRMREWLRGAPARAAQLI